MSVKYIHEKCPFYSVQSNLEFETLFNLKVTKPTIQKRPVDKILLKIDSYQQIADLAMLAIPPKVEVQ